MIQLREFSRKFYKSKQWKQCRQYYIDSRIKIDGVLCETCHDRLGKIVHHKTWITPSNIDDESVTLNQDNLKYECLICHNKEKQFEEEIQKYIFDESGDCVAYGNPPR